MPVAQLECLLSQPLQLPFRQNTYTTLTLIAQIKSHQSTLDREPPQVQS